MLFQRDVLTYKEASDTRLWALGVLERGSREALVTPTSATHVWSGYLN